MTRLPKFEGMTFRGTRMTLERLEKYYPKGKAADDPAFISTSVNPGTDFKFAKPGVNGPGDKEDKKKIAAVFVVQGKTGRPVSNFAHMHDHEKEILFVNHTPMEVADRSPVFSDSVLGKTQIIYLREK